MRISDWSSDVCSSDLFGDILNRNQIYTVLSVNGEIYDIGGQAMYQNRAGRVNYGFGIGHIPYMSSFLGLSQDSLAYQAGYIPTITYDIYTYPTFLDQGPFFSSQLGRESGRERVFKDAVI